MRGLPGRSFAGAAPVRGVWDISRAQDQGGCAARIACGWWLVSQPFDSLRRACRRHCKVNDLEVKTALCGRGLIDSRALGAANSIEIDETPLPYVSSGFLALRVILDIRINSNPPHVVISDAKKLQARYHHTWYRWKHA